MFFIDERLTIESVLWPVSVSRTWGWAADCSLYIDWRTLWVIDSTNYSVYWQLILIQIPMYELFIWRRFMKYWKLIKTMQIFDLWTCFNWVESQRRYYFHLNAFWVVVNQFEEYFRALILGGDHPIRSNWKCCNCQ